MTKNIIDKFEPRTFLNHEMWDSKSGPWAQNLDHYQKVIACWFIKPTPDGRYISRYLKLSPQYGKSKAIFGYRKSVVNLWLNALGRWNSTQDSEVQGSNPDQNMLPPGPTDRTLLSQHLMAWTKLPTVFMLLFSHGKPSLLKNSYFGHVFWFCNSLAL